MVEVGAPEPDRTDVWPVPGLATDPLAGSDEAEEPGVSALLMVDMDVLGLDTELSVELIERFSVRAGNPELSGGVILTTFTPWPALLFAGMNSVVLPSFRLRCVRSG